MHFFYRGFVLLLLLFPVSAWGASTAEQEYRKARAAYDRLLGSAQQQQFRDNWDKVIDGFVLVSRKHSDSSQAPAGLYMAGQAAEGLFGISRRREDARRAVQYYDQLADKYPGNRLCDDALVLAGRIYEEIFGDSAEALRRYRRAVEEYPKGDMTPIALRKTVHLAPLVPQSAPKTPAESAPAAPEYPAAVAAAAPAGPASGRTELTGIRFWSNPGYTRVVLDLSGPVDFHANLLRPDPSLGTGPRLYVDLKGSIPAPGLTETTNVNDGLLRQIRMARSSPENVRVVLDLVSFQDYKVFPLEDPLRLVLDIQGEGLPQMSAGRPEIRSPPTAGDEIGRMLGQLPKDPPAKRAEIPPAGGLTLRRIVIDPGHGGRDPGAVGPSGIKEKDVTLSISRILARKLKEELGCDVILTRNADIFLPLEERTAIANRVGADLFISVHVNAAPNREAYGIETYYLNFSRSDKAAAVAARENGTSLKQVGDLELILFDLMANSKINESSRLAAEIQKSMVSELGRHYTQVRDLGVRQGPFYVLLGATMPSVLVEAGFISHGREEKRLIDPKYQERTAAAIVRAVRSFSDSQRMIATR